MDVYPNSLDLVQEAVAGYFVINIEFECVKLHRSIMSTELKKKWTNVLTKMYYTYYC